MYDSGGGAGVPLPRLACDAARGEICDVRAFGAPTTACLEACTVGAETTDAERFGAAGGNPTCDDPGAACFWSGATEATDAPNGSCLPGNYNDESAYDVGTACLDDADCYSPFGYGRCLFTGALDSVESGICAIGGCAGGGGGLPIGLLAGRTSQVMLPADLQDDVCDTASGDLCVGFSGGATFCMHRCASASDCPAGYACPAVLSGGGRICWPNCEVDADCRGGATCRDTLAGSCEPTEECYCSDATPAPTDAGPSEDAGVGGDSG
jgi:hypothetical protein